MNTKVAALKSIIDLWQTVTVGDRTLSKDVLGNYVVYSVVNNSEVVHYRNKNFSQAHAHLRYPHVKRVE